MFLGIKIGKKELKRRRFVMYRMFIGEWKGIGGREVIIWEII